MNCPSRRKIEPYPATYTVNYTESKAFFPACRVLISKVPQNLVSCGLPEAAPKSNEYRQEGQKCLFLHEKARKY